MSTPITKPADRMPLASFVAARQVLREALAQFPEPTCHTCHFFEMGRCKQFDQEVPAEFQKQPERCDAWVFDGIPF